jgi:hypothetical protein
MESVLDLSISGTGVRFCVTTGPAGAGADFNIEQARMRLITDETMIIGTSRQSL